MRVARAVGVVVMATLASGAWPGASAAPFARPSGGQAGPVALDNGYVRVSQNVAACAAAHTPGFGTRVIVALSHLAIESSRGAAVLERGGVAVFQAGESYTAPVGEFFEVAFKAGHPALTAPDQWLEPEKNTVVYEDEQIRVFEERLPPHGERQLHSHAQRVVVRLNPVRLTDPRSNPAGTAKGSLQEPNTVKFAEPIVHVVRNLSDIPLFNLVIEFKLPRESAAPESVSYR